MLYNVTNTPSDQSFSFTEAMGEYLYIQDEVQCLQEIYYTLNLHC